MANIIMTVYDVMIACGIDNEALFMEETQAPCIADDIFDNQFASCMDITFMELDNRFKTYAGLTVAQGQICLRPGIRKNFKAFVQWTRDESRLGRDPSSKVFPVPIVCNLIRRYKTHERFISDMKTLSEAAKPEKFKETTKWRTGNQPSSTLFDASLVKMVFH